MPRYFRYLRIAFTATCLIACVLLVALWIRSYWRWDIVAWGMTTKQGIIVSSQSGGTTLQYSDFRGDAAMTLRKWHVVTLPSPGTDILPIAGIDEAYAGFLFLHGGDGFLLVMPYWFLVPLSIAFAAVHWIPWWSKRFSLRTLLIATTLVAVVLGLIAWAAG